MARVVDADKLIEYLASYRMPIYTQPPRNFYFPKMEQETNQALNNALSQIQMDLATLNSNFISFQYMLTDYIRNSSFEQPTCLLCHPGTEGFIPGIDPGNIND